MFPDFIYLTVFFCIMICTFEKTFRSLQAANY